MSTNYIYPFKSLPLELERVVEGQYVYYSQAPRERILSAVIDPEYFNKNDMDEFAKLLMGTHTELKSDDSYFTLKEGLLNTSLYGLGNVLIGIEYNYARNIARIRIIGKRLKMSRNQKLMDSKKSNGGVSVHLLTKPELEILLDHYLRIIPKKHRPPYQSLVMHEGKPEIVTDV